MTPWRDVVRSPAWVEAVTSPRRVTSSRVEAVSVSGAALGDVPVLSARVSFDGEQAEQWRASFAFTDPALVPTSPRSILDGRSGVLLRPWWRVLTAAGWLEVPLGTFVVEDPEVEEAEGLRMSVGGLDPLAVARRGGYGGAVVPVGGLTASQALRALFATVMPGWPVSIGESAVVLPASMELWARDPAEDWTEIAAMAGMVVRTDRMGVITAAVPPSPSAIAAQWVEGPGCPVVEVSSVVKTSTIPRRVVVVSTSPDVSPPVVGEWVNPDADAMTIVTETRVESSAVTSVEGARALARLTGERWARPQQSVSALVPPRPDLGYRDLAALTRERAGVAGVFAVSGWEMTMGGADKAPGLMSVRMMARQ